MRMIKKYYSWDEIDKKCERVLQKKSNNENKKSMVNGV